MTNLRKYGTHPFNVAAIHGGPGAPGEMAPVARELSGDRGVLEPLQTANTLEGQVLELKDVLEANAASPLTLIGFSWGAMLSFIFTARHPSLVKKLIMVGSAVFEEKYAGTIMNTRLDRLGEEERAEALSLIKKLENPAIADKNTTLTRFGELITSADSYAPLPGDSDVMECQYEINRSVWNDARELRNSGRLLEMGKNILCPVLAIHGDYDPHPVEGVEGPLSRMLKDFRFILLEKCGHRPWLERYARDRFYDILKNEIA